MGEGARTVLEANFGMNGCRREDSRVPSHPGRGGAAGGVRRRGRRENLFCGEGKYKFSRRVHRDGNRREVRRYADWPILHLLLKGLVHLLWHLKPIWRHLQNSIRAYRFDANDSLGFSVQQECSRGTTVPLSLVLTSTLLHACHGTLRRGVGVSRSPPAEPIEHR